jgi:ribosomal protein S18 acetylase RimI-like enzyme
VSRVRWRQVTPGEVQTVTSRLLAPIDDTVGLVRHMYLLSVLESSGPSALRVATLGSEWALAAVFPGRLLVPAGSRELLAAAGEPTRRWRLVVGDRGACDAMLRDADLTAATVHDQLLLLVDRARVPDVAQVPDAGARRAVRDDVPALARLAVQLHVADQYGPDPGRAGLRGYARRIGESVDRGLVWCVGPRGAPIAKLERSVSSRRWGVQLSGIVIDEPYRGMGIGTRLVAQAVRHAIAGRETRSPITLHVRDGNDAALRAYAAAGFVGSEPWRVAVRA